MKNLFLVALAFFGFQTYNQAQNLHHFGWLGHQMLSYDFPYEEDLCRVSIMLFDAQNLVHNYESTSCEHDEDYNTIYTFDNDGVDIEGTINIRPMIVRFGSDYFGKGYGGKQGDCELNFAMAGGHSTLEIKWPSKGLSDPMGFGVSEDDPNFAPLETLTFHTEQNNGSTPVKAKFKMYNLHMNPADAIYVEVDWNMNPMIGEVTANVKLTGAAKGQTKLTLKPYAN